MHYDHILPSAEVFQPGISWEFLPRDDFSISVEELVSQIGWIRLLKYCSDTAYTSQNCMHIIWNVLYEWANQSWKVGNDVLTFSEKGKWDKMVGQINKDFKIFSGNRNVTEWLRCNVLKLKFSYTCKA